MKIAAIYLFRKEGWRLSSCLNAELPAKTMESELFSEISSDYYVQRFKINDEWTDGRNVTIHAECSQNAEKVDEHCYFLELYLSVDDFGFRDFLLGVSFGTEIMDKEELDAEINSWIGQTITDETFQSQIETYLKAAEAREES